MIIMIDLDELFLYFLKWKKHLEIQVGFFNSFPFLDYNLDSICLSCYGIQFYLDIYFTIIYVSLYFRE